MKGQNIDFSTSIQKKKQSSNNNDKTTQISGDMVKFSVGQSKKDLLGSESILTGKNLNFDLTIVGKWSLEEKKPSNCMICKLPLKKDQKISRCPMCHSLFHDSHIYEWLKIKGKCPVCSQSLRPGGTEEVKL
ncbi:MAG: E3 ubiquitin protein ligase [Asgard group archaeon]|nr:E3 ubiquitin protein ligase [Asgard group archaeon]